MKMAVSVVRILLAFGAAITLSACANPKVVYNKVTGPNADGDRVFRLSESVVSFGFPSQSTPAGSVPDYTKLTITSAPVEHDGDLYSLKGADWYENWGVATDLNSTRVGDTKLLKSVGSKITDERASLMSTAASVATNILAMVAAGPYTTPAPAATATAPTGLSMEKFLHEKLKDYLAGTNPLCKPTKRSDSDDAADGLIECTGIELEGGSYSNGSTAPYVMDITIEPVPQDAFRLSDVKFPYTSGALIYSACRSAHLTIRNSAIAPNWRADATVVIADPHWLEATAFPPNGTVTTGNSCGADSASNAYTQQTPLDYIKAASDAAKSIKDQLDKAKSAGTK